MNKLEKEILSLMSDDSYRNLTKLELNQIFYTPHMDKKVIEKAILSLEKSGLIVKDKKNRYGLPENNGFLKGIIKINRKGFGFILQESEDVFVPNKSLNGAMNEDEVLFKIVKEASEDVSNRKEGEVVTVITRANETVVGTFVKNKNFGFVVPLKNINYDIYVSNKNSKGIRDNDIVVAKIIKYPDKDNNPEGIITEILGRDHNADIDIKAELIARNIPSDFPSKVYNYLEKIKDEFPKEEYEKRKDFRDKLIFTIDGAKSKDLDDAISVEVLANGNYLLGVYIADVSNYVLENSPLDKEALKRGTSIYFNNKVVPMLPKKLSNDLCSLNPNEDRLVLALEIEINKKGKIISTNAVEGIISSKYRLVYEDVTEFLENKTPTSFPDELQKALELSRELSDVLRKKRVARGSIDFEAKEKEFYVENGNIFLEIKADGIANRIIEDFMITANEAIAEVFEVAELPFVYRVHEEPDLEKLNNFLETIGDIGNFIKNRQSNKIYSKDIQIILNNAKDTLEKDTINNELLRIMQKAKYSDVNIGHFGLASNCYTHFTSPIRRYPDLQIHRIIKDFINGRLDSKRIKHYNQILFDVSVKSSSNEVKAMELERRVDEILSCHYMNQYIGKVFNGKIMSVNKNGYYILLENYIRGFLKNDNATQVGLSDANYKIGTAIKVVVKEVDFLYSEIVLTEV